MVEHPYPVLLLLQCNECSKTADTCSNNADVQRAHGIRMPVTSFGFVLTIKVNASSINRFRLITKKLNIVQAVAETASAKGLCLSKGRF